MKRSLVFAAAVLCVASSLFAAAPAPGASLLKSKPEKLLINEILELKPAAGYHFNVKAPQDCGGSPILALTPRTLRCQMAAAGRVKISLNLCGDDESVCIPEEFELTVVAPKGYSAEGGSMPAPSQPPKGRKEPLPGFVMNDPNRAVAEARQGDRLLLIDFYAPWCPGCNILDEEVWTREDFLKKAKGVVPAAMDSDSDLSWPWKAHFKVGGYPTVILADARLREIGRFVGSRPADSVLRWIEAQGKLRAEPVTEAAKLLKDGKAADKTPARRRRVGLWHFERYEYAEAVALLEGLKDEESRKALLESKRRLAEAQDDSAASLELLKRKIKEFPGDVEFGDWVATLAGRDKAAAVSLLPAARRNLRRWRGSSKLAETGYSAADLLGTEAHLVETLGDQGEAKKLYLETAKAFEAQASRSALSLARGANLERAFYLKKAGQPAEARALYESLAKTYAEEFTFNYGFADLLHDGGEHAIALEYAAKAEGFSYGDNWLRAVGLKAEIELDLGRPEAARATLESALGQAVLPSSTAIRSHRYVARLRSLLERAEKEARR